VLLTVQALSKVAKKQTEREGELTIKPLETSTPNPKSMIRETGGGGGAAHWECWGGGW